VLNTDTARHGIGDDECNRSKHGLSAAFFCGRTRMSMSTQSKESCPVRPIPAHRAGQKSGSFFEFNQNRHSSPFAERSILAFCIKLRTTTGSINIFKVWNSKRYCCARKISQEFFECKVKRPNPRFCEYSLCMGDGFICNHPNRAGFSSQK